MRFDRLSHSCFLLAWGLLFALGASARPGSSADKVVMDKELEALGRSTDKKLAFCTTTTTILAAASACTKAASLSPAQCSVHRPELQKEIDDGLAAAEKQPLGGPNTRNLAVHKLIQNIRTKLKPPAEASPKPPDATAKGPPPAPPPPKVEPAPPPTPPTPPTEATTLWKRMGGEEKIKKIIDGFVTLTVDDPKVNFSRGGKFKLDDAKSKDLKDKLLGYISSLTDGTFPYTGKPMPEVHKDMGITQTELDQSFKNLRLAVEAEGVAAADVEEFMKRVQAKAKEFLPPPPADDKKDEKKDDKKDEKKEDKKDEKKDDKKDDKKD
ncbi:MAG: hypothetical protein U0746_14075 [Gemmataceae bacterium]